MCWSDGWGLETMPGYQWTRKFTWLMDEVEVQGHVRLTLDDGTAVANGTEVGIGDFFDVAPDSNYTHLVATVAGSNGLVHCETYPQDPEVLNRWDHWALPKKPDSQKFIVEHPKTGQRAPLRVGDHVRLVGRWVIENGHPLNQQTHLPSGVRTGDVFIEFHPFHWDSIQLVVPPDPPDVTTSTLSLAAPTYGMVFVGQGKHFMNYFSGNASWPWESPQQQRLFLWEAESEGGEAVNVPQPFGPFSMQMQATLRLQAPKLPPGFHPHRNLLSWSEAVLQNGTGLPLDNIRTITREGEDTLLISAIVRAPTVKERTHGQGSSRMESYLADVNDPAKGYSVFQARYGVFWGPRLTPVTSVEATEPVKEIELSPQPAGTVTPFSLFLRNSGPDDLTLTEVSVEGRHGIFGLDNVVGAVVPSFSVLELKGRFFPRRWIIEGITLYPPYTVTARIIIKSSDPAHESTELMVIGHALVPPPVPASFELSADSLDFSTVRVGKREQKSVKVKNISSNDIRIDFVSFEEQDPSGQFSVESRVPGILIMNQTIKPGESGEVAFTFAPTAVNRAFARVKIALVDASPWSPDPVITLWGSGI